MLRCERATRKGGEPLACVFVKSEGTLSKSPEIFLDIRKHCRASAFSRKKHSAVDLETTVSKTIETSLRIYPLAPAPAHR